MKQLPLTTTSLKQCCLPAKEWPDFIDIEKIDNENDEIQITCLIPSNLKWFEGHYPEQPVLPGVVQVNWACELARIFFPRNEFQAIHSLKFTSMILPETQLILTLKSNPKTESISFTYANNDHRFSSGKIVFKDSKS